MSQIKKTGVGLDFKEVVFEDTLEAPSLSSDDLLEESKELAEREGDKIEDMEDRFNEIVDIRKNIQGLRSDNGAQDKRLTKLGEKYNVSSGVFNFSREDLRDNSLVNTIESNYDRLINSREYSNIVREQSIADNFLDGIDKLRETAPEMAAIAQKDYLEYRDGKRKADTLAIGSFQRVDWRGMVADELATIPEDYEYDVNETKSGGGFVIYDKITKKRVAEGDEALEALVEEKYNKILSNPAVRKNFEAEVTSSDGKIKSPKELEERMKSLIREGITSVITTEQKPVKDPAFVKPKFDKDGNSVEDASNMDLYGQEGFDPREAGREIFEGTSKLNNTLVSHYEQAYKYGVDVNNMNTNDLAQAEELAIKMQGDYTESKKDSDPAAIFRVAIRNIDNKDQLVVEKVVAGKAHEVVSTVNNDLPMRKSNTGSSKKEVEESNTKNNPFSFKKGDTKTAAKVKDSEIKQGNSGVEVEIKKTEDTLKPAETLKDNQDKVLKSLEPAQQIKIKEAAKAVEFAKGDLDIDDPLLKADIEEVEEEIDFLIETHSEEELEEQLQLLESKDLENASVADLREIPLVRKALELKKSQIQLDAGAREEPLVGPPNQVVKRGQLPEATAINKIGGTIPTSSFELPKAGKLTPVKKDEVNTSTDSPRVSTEEERVNNTPLNARDVKSEFKRKIARVEDGVNADGTQKVSISGARGEFQITGSTAKALNKKFNTNHDFKTTEGQNDLVDLLIDDNYQLLKNRGLKDSEIDTTSLYIAHNIGDYRASQILKADESKLGYSEVDTSSWANNPSFFFKSGGKNTLTGSQVSELVGIINKYRISSSKFRDEDKLIEELISKGFNPMSIKEVKNKYKRLLNK